MKELLLKASGMWRSVHLFRSFFFFILFFTFSLAAWPVATTYKNWSIFKVTDQVYFFSDLDALYRDIGAYKCTMPDSIIFRVIKLNFSQSEKDLIKTAGVNLNTKAPFEPQLIQLWNELKMFLKIENYLNTQKVIVTPGLEKQILSLAKSSNCPLGTKNLAMVSRLIKAEIFLKSRFNSKSVWITDEEIKKIQLSSTGPKLSLAEIKEKELVRKVNESIDSFNKTIERQIPSEDFW